MTREQRVRAYAAHLALRVRGNLGAFKLVERYGKKRTIGTYKTLETLRRGIEQHSAKTLSGEREQQH